MRRAHLFEFCGQDWLPQVIRDTQTAYLTAGYRLLPLARLWAEKMSALFHRGEPCEILDLCSGAGGPMPAILTELERTMFAGFHHFRPEDARKILRSALDAGRAICIFEPGSGTLQGWQPCFWSPSTCSR